MYVGSATGELHAVDLADGKAKWKYKAAEEGIGESSPAVAGGIVYVGDLAGVLHAVDAATGKAVWTFKTGTEIKSSPAVAGDRVLIGSYDSHLYALGAKDGKLLWKVRTDRGAEGLKTFIEKVRIYDIADQDGIADWILREFPGLFYVLAKAPDGQDKRIGTHFT